MKLKPRAYVLIGLAATATFVAGCSIPVGAPGTTSTFSPVTPSVDVITEGADTEGATSVQEAEVVHDMQAAIGESITWPDGMEVRVSYAGTQSVTEYDYVSAEGSGDYGVGTEYVTFQVDVMNGSSRSYDPSMYTTPMVAYDNNGITEVAWTVYTSESGGEFPSILPSGKSASKTYGFIIPEESRNEVYIEFSPDDYATDDIIETGLWIGEAK